MRSSPRSIISNKKLAKRQKSSCYYVSMFRSSLELSWGQRLPNTFSSRLSQPSSFDLE